MTAPRPFSLPFRDGTFIRPRDFTQTLQAKLGTWSANVQTLLTAIQKSNER